MSPEALHNCPVSFKGDIYALGLILHFMMAKQLPDFYKHVKKGNYELVPETYSREIV